MEQFLNVSLLVCFMSMNYVDLIKKIAKIAAGLANRSASKSVLLFMYYYSFINIILVFIC